MAWLKTGSWFQSFFQVWETKKNQKAGHLLDESKGLKNGIDGERTPGPNILHPEWRSGNCLGHVQDICQLWSGSCCQPFGEKSSLEVFVAGKLTQTRGRIFSKWPQCDGLGPELLTLTISYMIFIMANYTVGTWILMMHLLLPKWTVKWKMIVVLGLRRTSMSEKSKVLRVAMPHVPGFRAKCCHSFGQVMRWKNVGVYGILVHKSPKPKWENSQNWGS